MVEPYLAMKGFVPTCLTRWCSSFALALHAAEEQGKITEDRARLVVGAKVNRVKSREEVFWNVTPSQAEATAQAGPTAYRDGLKWAYERRPWAWWASRRLSGSMERDLRHACIPGAAARGGFRAARRWCC